MHLRRCSYFWDSGGGGYKTVLKSVVGIYVAMEEGDRVGSLGVGGMCIVDINL